MTWIASRSGRAQLVQIHVAPPCAPAGGRIELSSGTRIAEPAEIAEGPYEVGARLPAEPWRTPTEAEIAQLVVAKPAAEMARSICVVRPPGDLPERCRRALGPRQRREFVDHVLQCVSSVCTLDGPIDCNNLNSGPPNRKTSTFDEVVGRYIGLHVDDWDQFTLNKRDRSTNRICVNVGQGDRYFLFLPVPLMEMARILSEQSADWAPPDRYTSIGRQFMERFPDLPVIRCRLGPG
jgi:hypothetical protein